jgi:hypothetical protein
VANVLAYYAIALISIRKKVYGGGYGEEVCECFGFACCPKIIE